VLQPAPLRHVRRVERAAPVPVLPAGSTDQNAHPLAPASYELSLVYPSAGKAIPEPVSRTWYIGVTCVHAESITWNDGAHERTWACRRCRRRPRRDARNRATRRGIRADVRLRRRQGDRGFP